VQGQVARAVLLRRDRQQQVERPQVVPRPGDRGVELHQPALPRLGHAQPQHGDDRHRRREAHDPGDAEAILPAPEGVHADHRGNHAHRVHHADGCHVEVRRFDHVDLDERPADHHAKVQHGVGQDEIPVVVEKPQPVQRLPQAEMLPGGGQRWAAVLR